MDNAKMITADGKKQLLKIGFVNDNNSNSSFKYLALGGENSDGSIGGSFEEINEPSYNRALLKLENESEPQSITITATFDETNCSPSQGIPIKEIGIVDNPIQSDQDTFFAYAEVPGIDKDSNISIKYTIIISIE